MAEEAENHSSNTREQSNDEIQLMTIRTAKSTKNWISKYAEWAVDNQLKTDLTEITGQR